MGQASSSAAACDTEVILKNEVQYLEIYLDKHEEIKNSSLYNEEKIHYQITIYHEHFENRSLDMKYKRIAVLDTETTNVYWNTAAPVQIAAVICDEKGNIIDSFNERIKTTHKIDPAASAVHGIYEKDLVGCRRESEVLLDFCV